MVESNACQRHLRELFFSVALIHTRSGGKKNGQGGSEDTQGVRGVGPAGVESRVKWMSEGYEYTLLDKMQAKPILRL